MMEFHISRAARDRYEVSTALFNFAGNVIFGDLAASRQLANRINQVRATVDDPAAAINAGAMFAMGLIDEVSHALVAHYRKNYDPDVMRQALTWFGSRVGDDNVDTLLRKFVEAFPNVAVYRGEQSVDGWLEETTEGVPNRETALEELLLLWLANQNLAFRPFQELFDDSFLATTPAYQQVTAGLGDYFDTRPRIGAKPVSLLHMLRAPMLASPDSLNGQLEFIRNIWGEYLGESFRRILLAIDVLKEEDLAIWMRFHPPSGQQRRQPFDLGVAAGQSEVPTYTRVDLEYERFSTDQAWMPTVVMIAKSTYVWLAQLSRQYGRQIERLDQIPDEELDVLASRGMNALWLIGVWERSSASKTIKRLCGQPDAVASAYSLASYHIAWDLGGDGAYRNLRDRAAARGIRLASDMVPNHMGIDSTWVIEHPDWFLSRPDCPYPAYRFEGLDLSNDGRAEIKIDDHYYEQSDAAVVFRRRDTHTNRIDYIYHGNDGTSFPWNDTAQLNYLNPYVREQVIQTILQVARLFPIIRFDAAMTLARRHVQRLWFPIPGSGGAIPSRAEYSMTQAEFDAAMPHEFWRDVVDRVAAEVPGTLLLAEAFWLMEGYFVRTLGMHRVYNSAFMNMLRDEDNAKYRMVLKNTLEFDPDILKRYVNFMSNPDERTAIDQFGDGDKYFGVCTLMATLPGLPMFGHGQVEAFTEKYGMEYKSPRYEENPNHGLVARHQREIAPLLKNRALFADNTNFVLYDFWTENGTVDENVFAYSNRLGDQKMVVLFHNRYAHTSGTIHGSVGFADKGNGGIRQTTLHDAFRFPADSAVILAYRNASTGLDHLRRSLELTNSGFHMELGAYQYAVLQNWRELRSDEEHPWDRLCDSLHGAGVPDVEEALVRFKLRALHDALRRVLDPALIQDVARISESESTVAGKGAKKSPANKPVPAQSADDVPMRKDDVLDALAARAQIFLEEAHAAFAASTHSLADGSTPGKDAARALRASFEQAMLLPKMEQFFAHPWPPEARAVLPYRERPSGATAIWATVLGWCVVRALAESVKTLRPAADTGEMFDKLRLRAALAEIFQQQGLEGEDSWRAAARIRVLLRTAAADGKHANMAQTMSSRNWWHDGDVAWLTQLHESDDRSYFRKEDYEQLLWWLHLPRLAAIATDPRADMRAIAPIANDLERAMAAAKAAGYDLGAMLDAAPRPEISGPAAGKQKPEKKTKPPKSASTRKPRK